MATLPEIAEWIAGVYQIEESDPVLGGPPNESTGAGLTNIPALQLAKRTAFLKKVLDDAGVGALVAPVVSDFNTVGKTGLYQGLSATGAPEPGVPFTLWHIQSSEDQATQIASRITSDRVWSRRLTAGAWSSWREFLHSGNAASILGNTPAQFDDTTALATTAFVQRALGNMSGVVGFGSAKTLTAADCGTVQSFNGTAHTTVTLPLASAVSGGATISFVNIAGSSRILTVARQGSEVLYPGLDTQNSMEIGYGETLTLSARAGGWAVTGGSAQLPFSAGFGKNAGGVGYQRFPGGGILQWGSQSCNPAAVTLVSLPVSFPSAGRALAVLRSSGTVTVSETFVAAGFFESNSTIGIVTPSDVTGGANSFRFWAFGY